MSGNIWAVGRNYQDHAKEMGLTMVERPAEPMIFLKAGSSTVVPGSEIVLPSWSSEIHHEVEVALRFDEKLNFSHLTIALDLTARDQQTKLKQLGHPWTLAKSFRHSCPLGAPVPIEKIPNGWQGFQVLQFSLQVNGQRRQSGSPADMLFSAEELRTYLISRFPVTPGDWLLTGTPAGVGPIKAGDQLEAEISGVVKASWTVIAGRPSL